MKPVTYVTAGGVTVEVFSPAVRIASPLGYFVRPVVESTEEMEEGT